MINQVNNQSLIPSNDVIQLTLTLKMITAQVVETSVTANNISPIQDFHNERWAFFSILIWNQLMLQLSLIADLSTRLKNPQRACLKVHFNIHYGLIHICWARAQTFVDQQMLNCVTMALGILETKITLSAVCFRTNLITWLARILKERWLLR